jgi:Mg-chelatase subunit ChlD
MTSFREENVPLALGVLIDNSGSMRPKRQKVNDAVLNLIRSSNPGDKVFVVNFGDQPYLDQDFTDDVGQLTSALNKIEARGTTALYDAIVASAAHVKQGVNMQKRVLLVVTDGRDNASQDSLDEAMRQLQRVDAITRSIAHDIRFQYVIGYKSSNPPGPHVYHRIDVQASNAGRQRLRVRTRTGYYSDSQGSQ